jgi:hypothetical protein
MPTGINLRAHHGNPTQIKQANNRTSCVPCSNSGVPVHPVAVSRESEVRHYRQVVSCELFIFTTGRVKANPLQGGDAKLPISLYEMAGLLGTGQSLIAPPPDSSYDTFWRSSGASAALAFDPSSVHN